MPPKFSAGNIGEIGPQMLQNVRDFLEPQDVDHIRGLLVLALNYQGVPESWLGPDFQDDRDEVVTADMLPYQGSTMMKLGGYRYKIVSVVNGRGNLNVAQQIYYVKSFLKHMTTALNMTQVPTVADMLRDERSGDVWARVNYQMLKRGIERDLGHAIPPGTDICLMFEDERLGKGKGKGKGKD